jgi:hypothetical protein
MPNVQVFTFRLLDPDSGTVFAETVITAEFETSARDQGRLALVTRFRLADRFEELQHTPLWMQIGGWHRR